MAIFNGQGWTKTILLDFQNERLLIYFLVFLSGSLCYKLKIFESIGKNKKLYIALSCTGWIPVALYLSLIRYSMKHPGGYLISEIVDALLIALTLLLSMLCLLYVTINTFRYFLNTSGKIIKELNKNSYGVYIIHVVVLGGIALTMLKTAIPSLLKYLILTVSTFAACNLIVSFYRKFIKQRILRNFTEGKI
jgi:succinate dehydrogenase/fumarate reductase cytochrome b subunit